MIDPADDSATHGNASSPVGDASGNVSGDASPTLGDTPGASRSAPAPSAAASAGRVLHRPAVTPQEAREMASDLWGLEGDVERLPGERDATFLVTSARDRRHVLKVSPAGENPAFLRCQDEVLSRLAERMEAYRCPRPVPAPSGETPLHVEREGVRHAVRLLEWVEGVPLSGVRPHSAELLRDAGHLLGTLDRALEGFDDPAAERELVWELGGARTVVDELKSAVEAPGRRRLLEEALGVFDRHGAPLLTGLRTGVIHNDANDENLLVQPPAADPLEPRRMAGLIDFGDLVRSYVAAEPAVAAAYAMLGKRDPLAAAARVLAGYHGAFPLEEEEVDAVFPLLCLRLAVSVTLSAHRRRSHPDDAHLFTTEDAAWALLARLEGVPAGLARGVLREACGMEPSPRGARVSAWLREHGTGAGAVLEPDPGKVQRTVVDLTPGSLETAGVPGPGDADAWTAVVFGRMAEEAAAVGLGRYDEVRRWYAADAFRVETDEGDEWRTVHLGVDLFAPPGTPVRAPLDAVVESVRDNAGALDYGPTVILRHEPPDGPTFHTLYGHLSRESVEGLEPGQPVDAGAEIGRIGAARENGGWAPHLHLQVVANLLGHEGTFPGVARPSRRRVWTAISPDPNLLLGLPELDTATAEADGADPEHGEADGGGRGTAAVSPDEPPGPEPDHRTDPGALLDARTRHLGPNLSVSYRRPLTAVRGWMQHLYDPEGQPHLDCVNNVAHVGHGHPRVVEALARQAAVLNTNTRYLHPHVVRLAERLTATLPDPLSVCWFVCSGSEANELALRLARAHTGRRGVVVLDAAYHGNTTSQIEISPYKFDGPGGEGAPAHVRVAPLPDPYRGRHRGDGPEVAEAYASHVGEAVAELVGTAAAGPAVEGRAPGGPAASGMASPAGAGPGLAAFFTESLPSCGGQIVLPDGFLSRAYEHVRAAGGVCVADEVQVGFGRVGSHFWGFETQGVVPDIVTLGKPMGNGHPLAAVVTTPEIAASFDTGMEYFNTFGGNPVSCAVGLAVLDVIEEEKLQERALRVGSRLIDGLRELAGRHPAVGDVRGRGLFVGVELVLDRGSREPAGRLASYVVERARDHRVLLSTDGPDHNVIKVKPPLVFSGEDADRVVETLDAVLGEDVVRSATEGGSRAAPGHAPPAAQT